MKKDIYTLKPFESFKCIGGECKTNCCIGWQIDIDKKTLKKYKKVKGEFAQKLKNGVDFDGGKFLMTANGEKRCVFLNEKNLCEIIINLGENYLCEVCREHPRFYNVYRGFTEYGVGLACERAANLLIRSNDDLSVRPYEDGKKLGEWEKEILSFRFKTIGIATDDKLTIKERLNRIIVQTGIDKGKFYDFDFAPLFKGFESINSKWKETFNNFDLKECEFARGDKYFENLLVYFLYRHLPLSEDRLDLKSRALFAVLSVFAIYHACKKANDFSADGVVICTSAYSAEIEYSEQNLNAALDVLDEISLTAE